MIERKEREKKILEILRNSETLVSGTYLAEFFDVSRQVIVQDIAILKAKNIDIISTNRGYRLVENINSKLSKPLKNLTDNCHYHTIIAENENIFKEVEDKLKKLGILIE